ncbi:D-tyrosyl-tRNA(Tyr) deacylase, partial [Tolypocladium capitatum]
HWHIIPGLAVVLASRSRRSGHCPVHYLVLHRPQFGQQPAGGAHVFRMKAIIQRVLSASVTVDKEVISSIGRGVLVFAAIAPGDTEREINSIASKVLKMRLWDDEAGGKWKKSVTDIGGEVLCVSQFTLLAQTKKGTKPDFHGAMNPKEASRLYHCFVQRVKDGYSAERVQDGRFQDMMEVALVNDGPVTLELQAGASKAAEEM